MFHLSLGYLPVREPLEGVRKPSTQNLCRQFPPILRILHPLQLFLREASLTLMLALCSGLQRISNRKPNKKTIFLQQVLFLWWEGRVHFGWITRLPACSIQLLTNLPRPSSAFGNQGIPCTDELIWGQKPIRKEFGCLWRGNDSSYRSRNTFVDCILCSIQKRHLE